MSRTARLFDLLQLLRRHRRPVVAAALAEELGVSKRTVYRDIETLTELGAPISGEAGVGFFLRPGFLVPPLMFTEEELEALALGGRWLAQQGDAALASAALDALAKIAAVLPRSLSARLEGSALMTAKPGATAAGAVDASVFRGAIRRERKMRLGYADENGRSSQRVVWPIALVFFESTRVVVAFCELRKDFRHFRVDRVTGAEVLDAGYPESRAVLAERWKAQDETSGRRARRGARSNADTSLSALPNRAR
ncbi:MAG: YafY family transcriptional regulator [Polyangiaceae bacterium]|nr:YafY family transcriptional regulator [Polyangiaceae bacterium]